MSKSIHFILIVTLFFLSAFQDGCSKLYEICAFEDESSLVNGDQTFYPLEVYERAVNETAQDIPVAYDVVVVGGTSGGVATAVEAAQKGAKVFLAAQRLSLGEDICGTYRLCLELGEEPTSPLTKKSFDEPALVQFIGNPVPL